jgi:nucleotide-binding universal stress UspA family protein
MTAPRWIVIGYDGSSAARAAITYAVRTFRGRRLMLVHAVGLGESEAAAESVLDDVLLEGNDELADARWDARAVHGNAAEGILRIADELDAEAIVLGTRGRGSVTSLLGSVSHRVVQFADRPVMVVSPAAAARLADRVAP